MRKILVVLILFLSFYNPVFSFDVDISADREEIFLDEKVKLILNIKNLENLENFEIIDLNFWKNFEIIWETQSNKFFSQSLNVNWHLEENREVLTNYSFTLQPKNIWEFEIWPIILTDSVEQKSTNSIKIKVLENVEKISEKNFTNELKSDIIEDEKKNVFLKYFIIFTFFLIIITIIVLDRKSLKKE